MASRDLKFKLPKVNLIFGSPVVFSWVSDFYLGLFEFTFFCLQIVDNVCFERLFNYRYVLSGW